MNSFQQKTPGQRLEIVIIAFFGLAALSLVVIYALAPSIVTDALLLPSSPPDRYPWLATLVLSGILAIVAIGIVGVVRHWRWLFWLLLCAFGCSALEVLYGALQLAGIVPDLGQPAWYSLFRMSAAAFEVVLAVWMVRVYRHAGVWGLGERKKLV